MRLELAAPAAKIAYPNGPQEGGPDRSHANEGQDEGHETAEGEDREGDERDRDQKEQDADSGQESPSHGHRPVWVLPVEAEEHPENRWGREGR